MSWCYLQHCNYLLLMTVVANYSCRNLRPAKNARRTFVFAYFIVKERVGGRGRKKNAFVLPARINLHFTRRRRLCSDGQCTSCKHVIFYYKSSRNSSETSRNGKCTRLTGRRRRVIDIDIALLGESAIRRPTGHYNNIVYKSYIR